MLPGCSQTRKIQRTFAFGLNSTGCLQVQYTLGAPLFSEVQYCLRSLSTVFDVGFLGDDTVETVYRVTGCRVKPDIG